MFETVYLKVLCTNPFLTSLQFSHILITLSSSVEWETCLRKCSGADSKFGFCIFDVWRYESTARQWQNCV